VLAAGSEGEVLEEEEADLMGVTEGGRGEEAEGAEGEALRAASLF
jgi:hypothetical protein